MAAQTPIQSSFKTSNIVALFLLIAGVVGIFIFVLPQRDSFAAAKLDLTQKEAQINSLKSEVSRLEAVESSFEGSEVTQKDIINLIPDEIKQDELIQTLAKIADDNEISLNSLSFGLGLGRGTDFNVVSITTNVTGTHKNLIEFLGDLEDESRKFKVNTISVQLLENRLENMSLNIEAYFL